MARRVSRDYVIGGEREGVINELHKPARKNFPRRHVTIKGLHDLFQVDLVDMRAYSDQNKGLKYLLTVVDAFTKRAWAIPLKTKSGKEVAGVTRKLLENLDQPPRYWQADDGSEFYNKDVKKVLAEFGVKLYSSFSHLKASIIERFNRTLKTKMWREFTLQGNYRWYDVVDRLIDEYNKKVHRTTGLPPIAVNKRNEKKVLRRMKENLHLPRKQRAKFKVGDSVRISKYKRTFEKGYTPSWTTEVFTIKTVQPTRPKTYKLEDHTGEELAGGFYEQELQKTKYKDTFLIEKILKRKGNQAYVKWLGFDKKYNQWIDTRSYRL